VGARGAGESGGKASSNEQNRRRLAYMLGGPIDFSGPCQGCAHEQRRRSLAWLSVGWSAAGWRRWGGGGRRWAALAIATHDSTHPSRERLSTSKRDQQLITVTKMDAIGEMALARMELHPSSFRI
jgi:hypothetical protein